MHYTPTRCRMSTPLRVPLRHRLGRREVAAENATRCAIGMPMPAGGGLCSAGGGLCSASASAYARQVGTRHQSSSAFLNSAAASASGLFSRIAASSIRSSGSESRATCVDTRAPPPPPAPTQRLLRPRRILLLLPPPSSSSLLLSASHSSTQTMRPHTSPPSSPPSPPPASPLGSSSPAGWRSIEHLQCHPPL